MGLFSQGRAKENADDDSVFESRSADEGAAAAGATRGRARKKAKDKEPVDPVLPEKQRARRRLVGAVALVLAAVIGLPMILDPEPKPLADDISIDIPSRDKPKQGAAARPPGATVPAAAALDKREEIIPPADSATPATAANAKPDAKATAGLESGAAAATSKLAAAGSKADAQPDAKPATKPADVAAATPKPAPKAEIKPDAKSAEEARARALLDGKPEPAVEKVKLNSEKADRGERYLVQVAALASADKVRELQNKLKAAGIKSQTQKVATESGERIRVRVGPVQGKAEAEKIRAKLNKMGLNGTLVPA
ncbi:MAG: hypothetical protein JWP36_2458 [Paucimonas sp.]|nr:hypothetical protein [Paucimonas sp.]